MIRIPHRSQTRSVTYVTPHRTECGSIDVACANRPVPGVALKHRERLRPELHSETEPTPALREILKALAKDLGQLPNKISIEGHTDGTPFSEARTRDNWDLSTERANEARRLMQANGVRPEQVHAEPERQDPF